MEPNKPQPNPSKPSPTPAKRKRRQSTENRKMTKPQQARIAKIHYQIKAGKYPNIPSLALLIEKGKRTIERDFEYMQDVLNLPMTYSALHRGWYYTEEVVNIPTNLVSESDLHLIAVMEAALSTFPGGDLKRGMKKLLKDFTTGLPNSLNVKRSNWRNIVSIRTPNRAKFDPRHLDFLVQAAVSCSEVELEYRKPNRTYEFRKFDPFHLFAMDGDWYVLSRDEKSQEVKRFSLTRMQNLRLTDKKFVRPRNFHPDQYLGKSFGLQSADGDYNVILRIKPHLANYIHEREWNGLTHLYTHADGVVELHLNLSSLIEIKRWVLGWDGGIRVMEPPQLRKMVADASMATYCENREEEAADLM